MSENTNEFVELGDRIKDPISGLVGICVSITYWLHGCERVAISPEGLTPDGKPLEDVYMDRARVVVVEKAVHSPVVYTVKREETGTGGPEREGRGFKFNPGRL